MRRRHPTILGVRPGALLRLYAERLSDHVAQELLAGAGIAVGVALLFAVMVANTSITTSASQLVHSITGSATVQFAARSSNGFDMKLAERAGNLPSVKVAAPVLREPATIIGPRSREQIQLVGVTPSMIALKSEATRNLGEGGLLLGNGIGLPSSVGEAIGVRAGEQVTVLAGGTDSTVPVRVVLGSQTVGAIADSPVAVVFLPVAQRLAGLPGRITEVLIQPQAGKQALAERELRKLSRGHVSVAPVDAELRVLAQAAGPNSESTTMFALIAAMVGALIALNAVLLTAPDRRRYVLELRPQGFRPRQVVLVMASQACILGLVGSLVGIALGYLLAHTLFHALPVYLTFAFPLGAHPIIQPNTVLVALASGLIVALVASLAPLWGVRPSRPLEDVMRQPGELGQAINAATVARMTMTAVGIVIATTLLVLLAPRLAVLGAAVLALAAVMIVPAVCAFTVSMLARVSENIKGSMLAIAAEELGATAIRTAVFASIAAIAVYGLVAVGGTKRDLTHGLNQAISQYLDTADVWVTPRGENVYTTNSFNAGSTPAAIARQPDIASVRLYDGALLDIGDRRMWIRARPPSDPTVLQASQMVEGNYTLASQRIRAGGWATISGNLATERHLKIGDAFTLPTPAGPARLRIAAITTNAGWPPGAITISTSDYRRYWQTSAPAAIEVTLKPGVSANAGRREVQVALGSRPALQVQTRLEREHQFKSVASQALSRLSEISRLLLIAVALAIAAMLSSVIGQRRPQLAVLKGQGFTPLQLLRALLLESTTVIAIGCFAGALLGIYGHALADRWLAVHTGYPTPFSPGVSQLLLMIALMAGIALLVIAVVGRSAARTPAYELRE
jgi:putative ABC transport system permease protein